MKPTPGVWGIDLGQCALKALRLQEIDGQLQATAFDYVEYPKILSQPDADPDQLTREALEQFLSRNSLKGDTVAIAIPGQSGLARFVKLPPVEEKKIADIVKFEAKQQIPFNLDEVVWDYQKLGASNVVDGFALETEIGLFAMKRDMVNKYLQHFKDVGVEVHVIQMAPLSLCNFVGYDLLNKDPDAPPPAEKQPCVVALDLGTDSSNLVVTDGVKVIWQRPIPLGGNHFTRALTKDLKLTFAKAEHLKRNATKSGAAELKKILASLKPVLNDFVGEVQRSLGYFTNTHRDAQIEYMLGLGNAFRLPGLQRFLSEKLQLEVRKLEKMNRISGDDTLASPIFTENILSFGVAYGLCLQGMKRAKLFTNLLPNEIRIERIVRAKKPWAVAAAGLLLAALGAAAFGNYLNERPYAAGGVPDAVKQATDVTGRATTMHNAFVKAKTDALAEEEAVKSIVAGQAERMNWLHLLHYVSEAVPQPDGHNLPPDPEIRKIYWDVRPPARPGKGRVVMSGKEAYEEYKRRLSEGFKPLAADDKEGVDPLPTGIDDLIQVSIESVDARFCDDLPGFWKAAINKREEGHVRPKEQFKKGPEGKGWVIEIAGYTYHQRKDAFVMDTLLTNLARMGVKEEPKPADGAAPGAGAPAEGAKGAEQPAPATGGGTGGAPAPAAAPTGGAGAADSGKVDLDSTKEPVKGRISHVLLLDAISKPASDALGLEIASQGRLDSLIGGGAAPGGMGGMPGMPGAPMMMGPPPSGGGGGTGSSESGGAASGPTRGGWAPLSSRTGGTAGGMGGGMAAGMGGGPAVRGGGMGARGMMGGGAPGAPMIPRPGMMGGKGGPGGVTGTTGATGNPVPGGHWRTEFIIVFVWQEPTPSDALRGDTGGGSATPAPATGGGGFANK
jgi:type IV pilus assembly protein PilM